MELEEWLWRNKVTIAEMARSIECNLSYLNRIVNKHVAPGKRLARDIVLATQGQVTEKELMTIENKEVA